MKGRAAPEGEEGPRVGVGRCRAVGDYRGGNWEFGAGVTRLALGACAVNPIAAQLMSMPTVPYGAPQGPVSRSGRVAARLKTTFSSIWRLSRPWSIAFGAPWPSCASHSGL